MVRELCKYILDINKEDLDLKDLKGHIKTMEPYAKRLMAVTDKKTKNYVNKSRRN